MAGNELNVEVREATGKGVARKLRAAGKIPGICYGQNETQSISLDPHALDRLIRASAAGMNTLIDLKVTGGGKFDGKKVLLKEMQRDPVNNAPLHADFFALDLTHKIEVAVPIRVTGTAVGLMMGGILDQVLREVNVECQPDAIPEEIVVDVTELEVGMSIHVRDLPLPGGVDLRSDRDLSVLSINAPKVEEEPVVEEELTEEEAAEAAAAAEGGAEEADASGEKDAGEKSGD